MRLTVSFRVARVIAPLGRRRAGAGLVESAGDLRRHLAVPHRVEHGLELLLVLAVDVVELEDAQRRVSLHTFASKNHIDR